MEPFYVCDLGSSALRIGLAGESEPQVRVKLPPSHGWSSFGPVQVTDLDNEGIDRLGHVLFASLSQVAKGAGNVRQLALSTAFLDCASLAQTADAIPSSSTSLMQRLLEIMFEGDELIDKCFLVPPVFATLQHFGIYSGLVVDLGLRSSRICQILDGHCLSRFSFATRYLTGGCQLTHLLCKRLLQDRGIALDYDTADNIKQDVCFVSQDTARDRRLVKTSCAFARRYYLPTAASLYLNNERFEIPENLFSPDQDFKPLGSNMAGLHDAVGEAVLEAPIDARKELLENILLVGGGAALRGLPMRLKTELGRWYAERLNLKNHRVTAVAPSINVWVAPRKDSTLSQTRNLIERTELSVFRGLSSAMASTPASYGLKFITRNEFLENGMRALQR